MRKPTPMQLRALAYLRQDKTMSARQAMLRAGFSENSARHPKANLFARVGVMQAQDHWLDVLAAHEIDTEILAEKYKQLLDATKINNAGFEYPDNQVRLEVLRDLKHDLVAPQTTEENKSVTFVWKRRTT